MQARLTDRGAVTRTHKMLLVIAAVGLALAGGGSVGAATSNPYGVHGGKATPSLQKAVGSAWTASLLSWAEVEPTRGRYDFTKFDAAVSEQAAAGVQMQFRVQTCAFTPAGAPFWGTYPLPSGVTDRSHGPCAQGVPRSQQDWYDFVYTLVLHYKNFAHPVRLFGINNEVNDPGQWPGVSGRTACSTASCPVYTDYVTTLATARKAAHAANPGVVVLDAGLSSPTLGVAVTRAKYEAGGKSDSALKAAIQFLNQYFSYRHPPGKAPAYQYINPNQSISQLRTQFTSTFYGTRTPQADRFYYFATHLYASGAMDAIQMHFYDYSPSIVTVLGFMHDHGGSSLPVYCWECGIKWPALDGKLYNYNPTLNVQFLQDKARLGFANGMVQMLWLPMSWGAPPAKTDLEKDVPLVCGQWTSSAYAPGLCAAGSTLTKVGVAFRNLAAP